MLIYSVLLVQTFLSLGLSFIFSVKAVTALALPDRTVPEKEKDTRTTSPSFTRHSGCAALGQARRPHASTGVNRTVEFVLQDLLSCHRAGVRMALYVYPALRTEPGIGCEVSESCSCCDCIRIFITVSVGCELCGEGISSWGGRDESARLPGGGRLSLVLGAWGFLGKGRMKEKAHSGNAEESKVPKGKSSSAR